MKIGGFYLLKKEYIDLIRQNEGKYDDDKTRPIYCCIQDSKIPEIYWLIPTSSISNRSKERMDRIKEYCNAPTHTLRSNFYHISHTDRPAIYKISSAIPITEKYVDREYESKGKQLILKDQNEIRAIESKLKKILNYESKNHNVFEQKITNLYNCLANELILKKTNRKEVDIKSVEKSNDSVTKNLLEMAKQIADKNNNELKVNHAKKEERR